MEPIVVTNHVYWSLILEEYINCITPSSMSLRLLKRYMLMGKL